MKNHIMSKHQKRRTPWLTATLAALAVLAAGVVSAPAGSGNLGNPDIVPPQSQFRGLSYSEWSARWFQWVYSLPVTNHPLFDTADCSAGQTGNVWFIDGTHGTPFPATGRECTIPAGTALFLPLAATFWDNEGCDPTGQIIQRTNLSELELRQFARDALNGFLDSRRLLIDGVAIQGLPECVETNPPTCETPYRVQSPVYDYTVPAKENILADDGLTCYDSPPRPDEPYTALGAVADGVYVMIKPLPVGEHTIRFGPVDPATGDPSRLYIITVTGGK
jgi:hypothetical protein